MKSLAKTGQWMMMPPPAGGLLVFFLSALLLNISTASRRMGVAKDSMHNLTVLLHGPIKALRHLTNGESAAASDPSHTCGISGVH